MFINNKSINLENHKMRNNIIIQIVVSVFALYLTGCATSSKEGLEMGLGLGFRSKGETTFEVNDSVATAIGGALGIPAIKTQVSDVQSKVDEVEEDVGTAVDQAEESVSKVERVEENVEDAVEKAKESISKVEKVEDVMEDLRIKLQITEADLEKAKDDLRMLNEVTISKLESVTESQLIELKELIDDRGTFDKKVEEILRQQGLNEQELEEFKEATEGFSTEQILALLAAAAAGGSAGRFGKSRGQAKIDELEKKTGELANELKNK